jgi:hypothetical protein
MNSVNMTSANMNIRNILNSVSIFNDGFAMNRKLRQ